MSGSHALARTLRPFVLTLDFDLVQVKALGDTLTQVGVGHQPVANRVVDVAQHLVELAVLNREERVFQLALAILRIEVQEFVDDVNWQRTLAVQIEEHVVQVARVAESHARERHLWINPTRTPVLVHLVETLLHGVGLEDLLLDDVGQKVSKLKIGDVHYLKLYSVAAVHALTDEDFRRQAQTNSQVGVRVLPLSVEREQSAFGTDLIPSALIVDNNRIIWISDSFVDVCTQGDDFGRRNVGSHDQTLRRHVTGRQRALHLTELLTIDDRADATLQDRATMQFVAALLASEVNDVRALERIVVQRNLAF